MNTKRTFFVLTLIAVFAGLSLTSCSKDDDDPNKGIGNYYLKLNGVETNLMDAKGNSLAPQFEEEWVKSAGADAQKRVSMGRMDNTTAKNAFNEFVSTFVSVSDAAYRGKGLIPESGWIKYGFSLDSDAEYSGAWANAVVKITNDGAELLN